MRHTSDRRRRSAGIVLAVLFVCTAGLAVSTGVTAAQTADYDPQNPYLGMTVTASDSQIQDGEFYELRVVDSFDGGTVNAHSFVEELQADGTEIRIETDSLDPDENYFVSGPGLDSPTTLTEAQTFELREQTFDAGFGESDDSDDTGASTDADEPKAESETASYYGTVAIDGEPAPKNTTIEAEINGEVRGAIPVETAGTYGNATQSGEQLVVDRPSDNQQNVSFYITPPDTDRIAANQSVVWESGTHTQLNLSAEVPITTESNNDSVSDELTDETTVDANETTDEDTVADETTDTAPGFGVLVALVALAVVVLFGRHYRT